MITEQIGRQILENLNEIARRVNSTYEAVNSRTATDSEVRAEVTLMRAQLDRIEGHIVNDTVLQSVQTDYFPDPTCVACQIGYPNACHNHRPKESPNG